MRYLFKSIIITAVAFYATYTLIPTISLGSDPRNPLLAVAGLFAVSRLINPVFSIILLPINLITFGFISLALNIATVFAFFKFLPGFSIQPYYFPGANIEGIIIPPISLNELTTIILVAIILTIIQKILHLIFE